MEINCEYIGKHLAEYLNGSLDPDTSQAFRWHLTNCETCRHIGHDALRIIRSFLARRVSDFAQYTAT